jgi:hypothetical protein
MASYTTSLLNAEASYRQNLKQYLANLPILDRRVLDCRYAENKCSPSIAREMGISPLHVERILTRARVFVAPMLADAAVNSGMKWKGENNED